MNTYLLDKKYAKLLEMNGIPTEECLRKAGLPYNHFDVDSALTVSQYYDFIEAVGELIDPDKILEIAANQDNEQSLPAILVSSCSPNMKVCLTRLANYKQLVAPMTIHLSKCDKGLRVVCESLLSDRPVPRFFIEMEFTFLVYLFRKATRLNIIPMEITLMESCKHENVAQFWQCSYTIAPQNSILFSASDLVQPFYSEDNSVWQLYEPELHRQLDKLSQPDSISAHLRCALVESLPIGGCTIEHLATHLCTSRRSLQRRLAEENTTFQQQLDATRLRLALYYLKTTSFSTEEIAFLLGYEEANTLRRAFHRWTGKGFLEYKNTIINQ